jgi:sporulation protein YlmC with PRC-barrel domain
MMGLRRIMVAALAAFISFIATAAGAAAASKLVGSPVSTERGNAAGTLTDLIVDVRAERVVYVIVENQQGFHTLPVRALRSDGRVDMSLAGEAARPDTEEQARYRRAAKLMGEPLVHPQPGGARRIGTIRDFVFDPGSGHIDHVIVATDQGERSFGPGVLAHGRFPPLTAWPYVYPDAEDLGHRGYVRRAPSDDRNLLHDHQWK